MSACRLLEAEEIVVHGSEVVRVDLGLAHQCRWPAPGIGVHAENIEEVVILLRERPELGVQRVIDALQESDVVSAHACENDERLKDLPP